LTKLQEAKKTLYAVILHEYAGKGAKTIIGL